MYILGGNVVQTIGGKPSTILTASGKPASILTTSGKPASFITTSGKPAAASILNTAAITSFNQAIMGGKPVATKSPVSASSSAASPQTQIVATSPIIRTTKTTPNILSSGRAAAAAGAKNVAGAAGLVVTQIVTQQAGTEGVQAGAIGGTKILTTGKPAGQVCKCRAFL